MRQRHTIEHTTVLFAATISASHLAPIARTWRVEDPGALDSALWDAVRHDGPTLVDIIAQPLQDAAAPVSEWVS